METPPFGNAGACTHCGYCLPSCPTYRVDNDETESPRGRVSIVLALAAGDLTPDEAGNALSRCLLCRACHLACPAGVRPGSLVMQARLLAPLRPTLASRLLHRITDSHRLTALAALVLRWYRKLGWQDFVRRHAILARFSALERLESLLPDPGPEVMFTASPPEASAAGRPRVALLCGCMARLFLPHVAPAAANLLVWTGCDVVVWQGFGCCGSPYREAGDGARFRRQARRTLRAFAAAGPVDAVLCDSANCAMTIADYPSALADDPDFHPLARELVAKTMDFNTFLLQKMPHSPLSGALPECESVAYHDHCQTRFELGIIEEPRKLLDMLPVPRREITPPGTQTACCGAGGEYLLRQPDRSQAIRERKLDAILATGADCVVAGNPGCMLHLQAGLRQRGARVRVRHLAELLWSAINKPLEPKRGTP
ncbi:MAG: (Fe-S)-binding protein [Magnetococcales bacterium]|nr:(Fe-S)-binding protein [Magnetococcales bacterium]